MPEPFYRITAAGEIPAKVLHDTSLPEWENILLNAGLADTKDYPLSYAKVAEIVATHYWCHMLDLPIGVRDVKLDVTFVNESGFNIPTRMTHAHSVLMRGATNPDTL